METLKGPAEQRVILHNVRWETYGRLLAEHTYNSAPRFTYDRRSWRFHEPFARASEGQPRLTQLVLALTEELGVEVEDLGSTTLRRECLERGFEPGSSSYIENQEQIYGKDRADTSVDPPPDLVVDTDITGLRSASFPSTPKWAFPRSGATMWSLRGSLYTEITESLALPPRTDAVVSDFVKKSKTTKHTTWLMAVREWARNRAHHPD